MSSVSEIARDFQRAHVVTIPNSISSGQRAQLQEQVTNMQGSIWEYSDSEPWFLVGLRKNNPPATRQALESLMRIYSPADDTYRTFKRKHEGRRGGVSLIHGGDQSHADSEGRRVLNVSSQPSVGVTPIIDNKTKARPPPKLEPDWDADSVTESQMDSSKLTEEEQFHTKRHFHGTHRVKIVIKKTVELVNDMEKSTELVFHAVRASARFLTYPTPSIPSDNFIFGHVKGWIWLIYKGISHFNADQVERKDLDLYLRMFRKEMSLLAKEVNGCAGHLYTYVNGLKKLNTTIRKEVKSLRKKKKQMWRPHMDQYVHYLGDLKAKPEILLDLNQDRFFPTDWLFEPHPSQTQQEWDFFHFQWINLRRDWIDCEFEIRSDYSLHWTSYSSYPPDLQAEIIVHIIQHLKAIIEEVHNFQTENMQLSFDYHEVKFLKFAIDEVVKLKKHRETVDYTMGCTRKLFEDLAILEKVSVEYLKQMDWLVHIIEPSYFCAMHKWLTAELILPLEYSARRHRRLRKCLWPCRRKKDFQEIFGQPLQVVLLRSPISTEQLHKFFPEKVTLSDDLPGSAGINSYGISRGYTSSIFDAGLGRDKPLPLHHPLPKYRKRRAQKFNIFDINRLIEATTDCIITSRTVGRRGSNVINPLVVLPDVDIEKYLVVMDETQRFLLAFANIFSFMTYDLKDRVERLEQLMYSNLPEYYETLEKMIARETSKQMENSEYSGSRAFGRLHKIYQFIVCFMDKASQLQDSDLTYFACKTAYFKSYAKVQSWIYQKAATFSMYSLPNKQDMFATLFTANERPYIESKTREFVDQGNKLVDICEYILKYRCITIQ